MHRIYHKVLFPTCIICGINMMATTVFATPPATTNGEASIYSWKTDPLTANTSFSILLSDIPYYLNIQKHWF